MILFRLIKKPVLYTIAIIVILFSVYFFSNCSIDEINNNWPSNGTVIKNIKWELPLADTQNVLIKSGDLWNLPSAPDNNRQEITYTTYRSPILDYNKILGKTDQEAVHSNDTNIVEFYRFENGDVFLLGYTNPGASRILTVIDPPLLVMPKDLNNLEKEIISSGTAKKWNGESFEKGYKTTFKISKKDRGKVDLGNNKIQNSVLCEITISQDAGLPYGETNLILSDALTIQSNALIAEDTGTILEWGIRTRNTEVTRHIKNTEK